MLDATPSFDRSLAVQRACDDLSGRLRAGSACRAEEYFAADSGLVDDVDGALELLYTEFVVREQLGQRPQPQEWFERFPQWKRELSQVFEVHELVGGGETRVENALDTWRDEPEVDAASEGDAAAPCPRRIGGYEIQEEIGRGGMGIVYRAHQRGLGRLVALKTILPPHGERERARFRAEAEATARLSHPHIVPIFEVGQDVDTPYLSMEYVAGPSLDRRLARSVLAPRTAAELLQTLAQAVAYAHERGIIHRDLKPANILLGGEETSRSEDDRDMAGAGSAGSPLVPKITDFGLAKSLDGSAAQGQSVALVGTPSYMAPEQWAPGGASGPGVDIYSLGAILYECLTGSPPFRGASALDILELVRSREPVPPSQLAASIPRDLETICLKCLAKQPLQRYASANALAEDLRRFLADEPIVARPVGRLERVARWGRRNPLVAALLGGIACVLLAASVSSTSLAVWALREKSRADALAQQEFEARELAERRFRQAEEAVGKYLDGIEQEPRLQEADFHDLRRDLLSSAVPFYEDFVAAKPGDAEREANRGRAYGRLGLIRQQMGELEQATADYELMRDIFARLATNTNAYRREWAQSYHQLGWTFFERGKLPEAEAEFQRGLELLEQLEQESPDDPAVQQQIASTQRGLGTVWSGLSRRAAAEGAFRESLSRLERLAAANPQVVRHQEEVADLHTLLGNSLPDEAREAREEQYRRSVEIYQALAAAHPQRAERRYGLAAARNSLGALHVDQRQHEAAIVDLEQALELRKQLAAEFPNLPSYRRLLAHAHQNLGVSWKGLKRWEDAERELSTAIEILSELAANFPEAPESRSNLALAHEERAIVLQALGRPAESEREQRWALQLRQGIAVEFPAIPGHRELLAKCHTTLAVMLYRVDRYGEAELEFAAAVELRQRLAEALPEDVENWRQLALGFEQRAHAQLRLNSRAEALVNFRECSALWADRLAVSPSGAAPRFEAGRAHANLAALLDKKGSLSEAAKFYELAAERHQQAMVGAPDNATYARALWKDYFELSSVHARRKDHVAASEAAARLASVRSTSGEDAVWAARYLGRCVTLAAEDSRLEKSERTRVAQAYGDRAMEFLREAVRRGYRDTRALTKLEALAPLAQRPDFQQLVAGDNATEPSLE